MLLGPLDRKPGFVRAGFPIQGQKGWIFSMIYLLAKLTTVLGRLKLLFHFRWK